MPDARLGDGASFIGKARAARDVAVILVDASMLDRLHALLALPPNVIVVAADTAAENALGGRADLTVAGISDPAARRRVLCTAAQYSSARVVAAQCRRQLVCTRHDLHELRKISIGLMYERNQPELLRRIVDQGRALTMSDAACLFLLEQDEHKVPVLLPAFFGADSLPDVTPSAMRHPPPLPLDNTSIIGHAAVSKHHIVITDAYDLPPGAGFSSNLDFEKALGYRVKSMLVVPLLDRKERLIGVLAYVNRKRDRKAKVTDKETCDRYVVPYSRREVRLGRALASVAAASIENSTLYERIQKILESLVKAAVSAIDQRDPSTAGHSLRVAKLSCDLASAVERAGTGRYRDLRFTREQMRELHYAALLHDFGKVTVREDVLMKGKKLPMELCERVTARFALIRQSIEAQHYRTCCAARPSGREFTPSQNGELDRQCAERLAELERVWNVVRGANEPGAPPLPPPVVNEIAHRSFIGPDHKRTHYLTAEELAYLQIPHGTLNARERREIQSHVEQTYLFLLQIPWTEDLKNLATYARGHHEKLDGSGYPKGLKGDEIPVQTRLMTIADIFDALTQSDRPYKDAVAPDKALAIIQQEANAGQLDTDLVRVLVESQVYKGILR